MVHRRLAVSIAALLLAGACSDSTAPPAASGLQPHFLKWAGGTPHFTASGDLAQTSGAPTEIAAEGLSLAVNNLGLNTHQVSFWAVRGQWRSVQIDYQSQSGASAPFLRLVTYEPTYVPGRGYLPWGDSVLVTVTVDPEDIAVQLEPHGLQFGQAARMKIWYGGAGGDLNGDGVVDGTDSYVENQLLGLWYQATAGDPWTPINAVKSVTEKWLGTQLPHFSGYAVSW